MPIDIGTSKKDDLLSPDLQSLILKPGTRTVLKFPRARATVPEALVWVDKFAICAISFHTFNRLIDYHPVPCFVKLF